MITLNESLISVKNQWLYLQTINNLIARPFQTVQGMHLFMGQYIPNRCPAFDLTNSTFTMYTLREVDSKLGPDRSTGQKDLDPN